MALVLHLITPSAFAQTDSEFQTSASNLVILDYQSGEILFEKNARTLMYPASMTKIMTAIIVFDRLKTGELALDDEFKVSEDAWRRGGAASGSSTMFLEPNSKVKIRDLLRGVIVQSGNDACIVLAQGIAGSEAAFAELMNIKARELGLENANFVNATGWPDPNHKISAYELAWLARHSIAAHTEMFKIYAQREFTWNGITQKNRNPLYGSNIEGVDGMKTGHTKISKYGFVGTGMQNDVRRIFVINGLETNARRRSESRRVMGKAFEAFKVYDLYMAGGKVGSAPVFMGKSEAVDLVASEDVPVGLYMPARTQLKLQIKYLGPIPAPISEGEHIADLIITAPGRETEIIALLAGQDVKRKSIPARIMASLMRKILAQ
ncbi:MAG: D-alanyl-D-alanine carboxypeptidase [Robiginitomaculum sp.]|nr:MAG: D-alanyl-D-alanine carboxypeptidase [Robiginitomaculum sp.]